MSLYRVGIVLWVAALAMFIYAAVEFQVNEGSIQDLYYVILGLGFMLMAHQMLNFCRGRKKPNKKAQESS